MQKILLGNRSIEVDLKEDKAIINGKSKNFNFFKEKDGTCYLRLDNRVYRASIHKKNGHTLVLSVNGIKFQSVLKDEKEILLEELGMDDLLGDADIEVSAPMPGLILDVFIKPGQEVKKDEKLLILEAMKMENIIKAPADGVIAEVYIKKGESVDKNQKLVKF